MKELTVKISAMDFQIYNFSKTITAMLFLCKMMPITISHDLVGSLRNIYTKNTMKK